MHTILKVKPLANYQVEVTFENNEIKIVSLKSRLKKGIFEKLKDPAYFNKVYVDDEMGTICWPNGADLCPDVLYKLGKNA